MENITKKTIQLNKIYYFDQSSSEKYGLKRIDGNREINKNRVKKIYNAIVNNEHISPIEVDINTMGIIDGQHRFEAYKRLWKDKKTDYKVRILFIDIPKNELQTIIFHKNQNQKSWSAKDKVSHLRYNENPTIKILDDFCKGKDLLVDKGKKGQKDRYAIAFLKGTNAINNVLNQTITITKAEIEIGEKRYNEIVRMCKVLKIDNLNGLSEGFIQAWYEFRNKIDKNLIYEQIGEIFYFTMLKENMPQGNCTSKRAWLNRFEETLKNAAKEYNV